MPPLKNNGLRSSIRNGLKVKRPKTENIYLFFGLMIFCSALIIGSGLSIAAQWAKYQEKLNSLISPDSTEKWNAHNNAVDSYDLLLSLWRLQSDSLKFSKGLISSSELEKKRRQVIGHLLNYHENTPIGIKARKYESFPPSYEAAQIYVDAVKLLEERKTTINQVVSLADIATHHWSLFKQDLYANEDQIRDTLNTKFQQSITDEKEVLAKQIIALGISLIAFLLATFFIVKIRLNERKRIEGLKILIATLSHDLRSPLQVIQSAAHLLRKERESGAREKHIAIVESASTAIDRLIDDLFKVSQGERLVSDFQYVELESWFNELVIIHKIKAETQGLNFISQYSSPYKFIEIDSYRLRQVIGNILDNAIKYTNEGSVSLLLNVRADVGNSKNSLLDFNIVDTGSGISEADRQTIFKPFNRGSVARDVRGLGLGLAVVSDLAVTFGAQYEIKSSVGKGTSFQFICPATGTNILPKSDSCVEISSDKAEAKQESEISLLVVDDDPAILETMSAVLSEMGYPNDTASNGKDALVKLNRKNYTVVITDINMPGMDGFELAKIINSSGSISPYLIAISAARDEGIVEKYNEIFHHFLLKPFDGAAVANAIEKFELQAESGTSRVG